MSFLTIGPNTSDVKTLQDLANFVKNRGASPGEAAAGEPASQVADTAPSAPELAPEPAPAAADVPTGLDPAVVNEPVPSPLERAAIEAQQAAQAPRTAVLPEGSVVGLELPRQPITVVPHVDLQADGPQTFDLQMVLRQRGADVSVAPPVLTTSAVVSDAAAAAAIAAPATHVPVGTAAAGEGAKLGDKLLGKLLGAAGQVARNVR